MKIAITSTGQDADSVVDPRFGRAKYFIVIDTETDDIQVVENSQNLNAPQGAGIQSAQKVAEQEVETVITGNVGPKAYRTLMAAGIKVYLTGECTVAQAVERLHKGELAEADGANVEGHWS